ncbi:MAG: hypothetical protein AAB268_13170 [Elusimicrobiota bacterium]
MDATNFFVPEFEYYKAIAVIDDHSRKLLACPLRPDETGKPVASRHAR